MKVAIFDLDWRADDTTINRQVGQINNLLSRNTLRFITATDEIITLFYDQLIPIKTLNVAVVRLMNEFRSRGRTGAENYIETQVGSKSITNIIASDQDGTFIVVYEV